MIDLTQRKLSDLTYEEFVTRQEQNDLADVPPRARLSIKGGLVDWQDVLPQWYDTLTGGNRDGKVQISIGDGN